MAKIVGIDLGTTNSKDKELFMGRFFGGKFNSHNIGNDNQRGRNPEQGSSNLSTFKNFIELFSIHCDKLSQTIARLPLIPESTLKNDFLTVFTLAKMGICYNNSGGRNG